MPVTSQFDPQTSVCELHIQGVLARSAFKDCESKIASLITQGVEPRMLVFLENFGGSIAFNNASVTATVEGMLPGDDPRNLVTLG